MGVFGTGIFADDDALDVRGDYKHFLADAQSDEQATEAIARQYGANFENPAETTAFWLGLALTQWKLGRLDPRVKAIALRVINEGLDLKKWDGSPAATRDKRATVLARARNRIESAPQPARPLPKPLPLQLPGWESGEVIGVRTRGGRLALLHMIDYRMCSRYSVKAPVVSILNWIRGEPPTADELEMLSYINWRGIQCVNHLYSMGSPKRSPLPPEKFIHLGLFKPVTRGEVISGYGSLTRGETLDQMLADILAPYWENPFLPPHHPGFDKPESRFFRRGQ